MSAVAILLAAGEGRRLGTGGPKALFDLEGIPIVRRAFESVVAASSVESVVVSAPEGYEARFVALLASTEKEVTVVTGGATRQASAAAAVVAAGDVDVFIVHDAARALTPTSMFDACVNALTDCDAVCPVLPVTDTIKEVYDGDVVRTLDRSNLVAVQTPQGVLSEVYRRAHDSAAAAGFEATDDVALVERIGGRVRVIPGAELNMKITTARDVAVARVLLRESVCG